MYRLIQRFAIDDSVVPKAILFTLAFAICCTGLYAVGPWYAGGPTTAMGVTLESDLIRAIAASFYVLAGAVAMWGVVFKNALLRYRGAFLCSIAYWFLAMLRLLTFGLTPVIWLFILALGFIAGIIFLWEAGREVE